MGNVNARSSYIEMFSRGDESLEDILRDVNATSMTRNATCNATSCRVGRINYDDPDFAVLRVATDPQGSVVAFQGGDGTLDEEAGILQALLVHGFIDVLADLLQSRSS